MPSESLCLSECVTLACLWEATATKPGNVHRAADFPDLHFADFITSASVLGNALANHVQNGVGQAVLAGVQSTQNVVGTNTNLGIILLLAPLTKIPRAVNWQEGVSEVLAGLTPQDAIDVYEAIRLAHPGGMGKAEKYDLQEAPPESLLEAMALAADRDLIARQYTHQFDIVLDQLFPRLRELLHQQIPILDAVVRIHVECLANWPDSLIWRKRGREEADLASQMAQAAVKSDSITDPAYRAILSELDFWMRSSSGRNPGTTADLVTAALFCCLRNGDVTFPVRHWILTDEP